MTAHSSRRSAVQKSARAGILALPLLILPSACTETSSGPPPAAGIELNETSVVLELTDSVRLVATSRDASGSAVTGRSVAWTSSDPAVAVVAPGGWVKGVGGGDATITATLDGASASATVHVEAWNVADNAVIVDSARLELLSDTAERNAGLLRFRVLQPPAPTIATGAVIVGTQDGGFLRRVASSSLAGDVLTLQTEPAALGDVIQEGAFATTVDILFAPASPPGALLTAGSGEVLWGEGVFTYLAPGLTPNASGFDFSGANICQLMAAGSMGGATCPSQLSKLNIKSGRLDLDPDLQMDAEFSGFSLESFSGVLSGSLMLDLVLETEMTGTLLNWTGDVKLFTFTRPFYFQLGPVPVIGYFELTGTGSLSVKATAKGGMEAAVQTSASLELGASWTDQAGWDFTADYSGAFTPTAPSIAKGTLKGSVSLEAKAGLKPRVQMIFYGVIGPFEQLEPFGRATLALSTQACGLDLVTGVNAAIGFTIPFLDSKVADYAKTWNDPTPLYSGPTANFSCPVGQLDVTTATSGADLDPNGYRIFVDDEDKGGVAATGQQLIPWVENGTRTVRLDDVASNCTVQGGATRDVTVSSIAAVPVSFAIQCAQLGADIQVSVSTTGSQPDADGYILMLDGSASQAVGANGTVVFAGAAVGSHSIELSGLAGNCTVGGPNPQTVNVAAGVNAAISFSVDCPGTQITVSTQVSGPPASTAGWTVTLDGSETQPISPNGQVTFETRVGTHFVSLNGLPGNCTVTSANPASVTVTTGSPASVVFTVTCQADAITISVTTTGDPSPTTSYTVRVIGGPSQSIPVNGTVTFSNLAVGTHQVILEGVPSHCTAQGLNPQDVSAPGSASFQVICQQPAACQSPPSSSLEPFLIITPPASGLVGGGQKSYQFVKSEYGHVEVTASTTAPDDSLGRADAVHLGIEWLDYLALVPVDPARVGESVILSVRTYTLVEANHGDGKALHDNATQVNFSARGWPDMGESIIHGNHIRNGDETTYYQEIATITTTGPFALGSWFQFNGFATVEVMSDGGTATGRALFRIDGLVEAVDASGQPVPLVQICSASGTAY